MRRIVLLISMLLVSAVWAVAQYGSGSNSESQAPVPDTNKVTVQGCLGGAVGEFTLTDLSGATYQLTGNTQKMNENVGHTVRVTGIKPSGEALPGSMSKDIDPDSPPALSVISFEHVSPGCN